MDTREESHQQTLSRLQGDIKVGLDDLNAGRVHEADLERIKAIAKAKLQAASQ